mgnify:CR=1 FL=1
MLRIYVSVGRNRETSGEGYARENRQKNGSQRRGEAVSEARFPFPQSLFCIVQYLFRSFLLSKLQGAALSDALRTSPL